MVCISFDHTDTGKQTRRGGWERDGTCYHLSINLGQPRAQNGGTRFLELLQCNFGRELIGGPVFTLEYSQGQRSKALNGRRKQQYHVLNLPSHRAAVHLPRWMYCRHPKVQRGLWGAEGLVSSSVNLLPSTGFLMPQTQLEIQDKVWEGDHCVQELAWLPCSRSPHHRRVQQGPQ